MIDADANDPGAGEPLADAVPAVSAGVLLRQGREAAGLSLDAVAQQLKLAPRQVRALEDGDFTGLPGRTFVRGFVRNYARLVHIDAEPVLAALPGSAATPALATPTLQPTPPSIGELPSTESGRTGWTRWAIPVTLAAIVVAAAVYEFVRPTLLEPGAGPSSEQVTLPGSAPAAPVVAGAANDRATTALPNPMHGPVPTPAETTAVVAAPAAVPAAVAATPLPLPAAAPPTAAAIPAPAAAAPAKARPAAPIAPAPAAEATLGLAFRDYSWVEVKDRTGRLLLSRMNAGGTTEQVSGVPPFEVTIGNASDVNLTFRGKPVDLAPYTRQNVARVTLP